jgi:hypothetical protein
MNFRRRRRLGRLRHIAVNIFVIMDVFLVRARRSGPPWWGIWANLTGGPVTGASSSRGAPGGAVADDCGEADCYDPAGPWSWCIASPRAKRPVAQGGAGVVQGCADKF